MPAPRRKNLIASRRRRQDDGEEEDSVIGDFDDDSLSEASAVSNGDGADAAGSDSSDDGQVSVNHHQQHPGKAASRQNDQTKHNILSSNQPSTVNGTFKPTADNQALLHGIRSTEHSQPVEEIHFDDLPPSNEAVPVHNHAAVPTAPRHETFTQRARREHQEYIQQRNANPAFVPTRGGFFLHDDRNTSTNGPSRPLIRGRGRGYSSAIQAGYVH
jgi:hypothetical protein